MKFFVLEVLALEEILEVLALEVLVLEVLIHEVLLIVDVDASASRIRPVAAIIFKMCTAVPFPPFTFGIVPVPP